MIKKCFAVLSLTESIFYPQIIYIPLIYSIYSLLPPPKNPVSLLLQHHFRTLSSNSGPGPGEATGVMFIEYGGFQPKGL